VSIAHTACTGAGNQRLRSGMERLLGQAPGKKEPARKCPQRRKAWRQERVRSWVMLPHHHACVCCRAPLLRPPNVPGQPSHAKHGVDVTQPGQLADRNRTVAAELCRGMTQGSRCHAGRQAGRRQRSLGDGLLCSLHGSCHSSKLIDLGDASLGCELGMRQFWMNYCVFDS